ncbi:MAG: hypothetical protein ACXW2L_02195 [Burkholderiales bacterium]
MNLDPRLLAPPDLGDAMELSRAERLLAALHELDDELHRTIIQGDL